MKFTDIDQLKALRFLNNLDVVERSLHKEFELGRIDQIKLTTMLREFAEQRRNLYEAMETMPSLHFEQKRNVFNKLSPMNDN